MMRFKLYDWRLRLKTLRLRREEERKILRREEERKRGREDERKRGREEERKRVAPYVSWYYIKEVPSIITILFEISTVNNTTV